MHQIDCLILDQACGMFGCCGQLDISKYLGTLGLSTKPVTNGRSNAVRLKGQRGLLSDIWQRGRHGTLAGTEDVFAADEPVWCGSGSGREIISVHYWYPIVWASGVGRKPRTNERRLDAHMWMLWTRKTQYPGADLALFGSNLVQLWSNLRDRSRAAHVWMMSTGHANLVKIFSLS